MGLVVNRDSQTGGLVKLLKALVSFIVGTVVGALGNKLMGPFGAVLGFIAGGVAAWWVVRRMDV